MLGNSEQSWGNAEQLVRLYPTGFHLLIIKIKYINTFDRRMQITAYHEEKVQESANITN